MPFPAKKYPYGKFEVTNSFCVANMVSSDWYSTYADALMVRDTINRHHRRGFYAYTSEIFVYLEDGLCYTAEEYEEILDRQRQATADKNNRTSAVELSEKIDAFISESAEEVVDLFPDIPDDLPFN